MGKIIFILLILLGAAMAIPSTRAKMTEAAAPVMDKFRAKIVPGRLETMADQLEVRLSRGQDLPTSWEGWLRRDYSSVPEDPWGNLYYIESGRLGFTVGSTGPDGVQGNEDDIREERRRSR